MVKQLLLILTCISIYACSEDPKEIPKISMKQMQENLIEANKIAIGKESEQIAVYVKNEKLNVKQSQTGLRYDIYSDQEGENIKEKQEAVVKYTVSLLDGTKCYSTDGLAETFTVGKDYVESGLHEGIQYMSIGDKALIIIPSHLAHGLAGDFKKIPIKATIVYDIELIDIK